MESPALYALLADGMVLAHFLVVLFIVLGFAAILAGRFLNWNWVFNSKFRYTHLAFIGFVVLQTWLGRLCPLTVWEQQLRIKAEQDGYTESFIQHWLHRLLFFEAESWVFGLVYTIFGALVVVCWYIDRKRL